MSDPTLAHSNITLTERSQWPAWFIQFKFHALTKGVWNQVDPDGTEALSIRDGEPDLPDPDESLPKESIAANYSLELTKYRVLSSEYTATVNRLMHLWNWVNQTVDQAILTPIMMTLAEKEKSTLQALIIELRKEMAPTDQSTENLVRAQYRAHLQRAKQGRQNAEKWQQEWLHLYSKARAYKLSEVEGTLAIQDYLDAITPKLAPEWGRNMHQTIIQQSVLGQTSGQLTLQQVARIFSALLQEHGLRSTTSSGVFATLGSSPGQTGPKNSKQSNNKKPCPCGKAHKWSASDCKKLQSALTGKPYTLSGEESNKILETLNEQKYEGLKKYLTKRGWVTPKLGLIEGPNKAKYPGNVQAVLIDPIMLTKSHSPGVYSTMDFDAHPLSESTILDNGAAVHLVNNLDLIEPGSFVKTSGIDCVEAGTQSFPILGKGTRRIRSILNGERGERTEDLILRDVAVVERFHVNIVSEARLDQVGLWYLGLDTTLRMGTLEQNIVLGKLRREHNLTFIEYKPLMFYPTVMSVTHENRRNHSWTTFPRSDSAELWHQRAGHLGAEALEALVKSARNVRIKGIPRSKCEHCATTHARQVISRRPRERSPRPYWRISWDLFDMPKGRSGELWILLIKCDFSGKLHSYSLQAKTLNEIMRVFENFKSMIHAKYRLAIAVIMQDNDVATLPWRGTSRFQTWAAEHGITIESSPVYTHEPNGGAERAGQELILKSIKMRTSANLPPELWPEIVDAATWLYNMSPSYAHGLRAPNTVLDEWFRGYFKYYEPGPVRAATADLRPDWSGVYAYGCRAYPLNRDRAAGRNKRSFKVSPRGHIGYLVGYRASNIYRIWIPELDQVITTRNVTFDESLFYGMSEPLTKESDKVQIQKVADILHEDELRDAGEVYEDIFDQLRAAAEGQEAPIAEGNLASELGGESAQKARGSAGRPERESSRNQSPARVESTASRPLGIRANSESNIGLRTPEQTPEPGAHQLVKAAENGDYESSREVQPPGEESLSNISENAAQPRLMPGVHREQVQDTLQAAAHSGPVSSTAPNDAVNPPQGRAITRQRRDYGPPTRSSRRQRGEDPESSSRRGRSGAHMLYYPNDGMVNNELIQCLFEEQALRTLTTVHSVICAAFYGNRQAIEPRASSTEPQVVKSRPHRDDLPKEPTKWKDLSNHAYGVPFQKAAQTEIDTLLSNKTWEQIDISETNTRPLPLKWVFTYKVDQDGYFVKCKARIVVRGDLQITNTLHSTYAATLAARSFRTAMAIAAHFDLEIMQYDVVGAFLHANRENQPEVICELPDGYKVPGKCVKLKKALYGLKDSPLLWYEELSRSLEKLGLLSSKEEPCLFFDKERKILLLFYVDDILLMYHRSAIEPASKVVKALQSTYKIEEKGPVQWFLGVRVVRDRVSHTITLVHDEYIDKIAKKFNLASNAQFPPTPLPHNELFKSNGEATKKEIKSYQEKVGSILYTAIMLRPDIAFAASKLSHFLTNPSKEHFGAVDRVITYLYRTRYDAITYGGNEESELLICGDASFADDPETRKSSQGYLIMLFGGPIIWKAARQATVTTSTTEAELLALEQVSKETIALKRLFKELQLDLGVAWTIFCDNQQTIRLVVGENERITTKLRHVDIQNMWLRQEHSKGSFEVQYLPTASMPADGLTKNLSAQQFTRFKAHLKLKDVKSIVTAKERAVSEEVKPTTGAFD